jgi:hypothetical protein
MTDAARWHEFAYEQTDIPAGMTVRDWRNTARPHAPDVAPLVADHCRADAEGTAVTLDGRCRA